MKVDESESIWTSLKHLAQQWEIYRDTGGMAQSNKNVRWRQNHESVKQQKAVLQGELSHPYSQTLISAADGAKDFSGVSSYSPQESNNTGGTAARKSALGPGWGCAVSG